MNDAFTAERNFLLYVRNPVKIALLLIEFLKHKFKLTNNGSIFRQEVDTIIEQLNKLAWSIMRI